MGEAMLLNHNGIVWPVTIEDPIKTWPAVNEKIEKYSVDFNLY